MQVCGGIRNIQMSKREIAGVCGLLVYVNSVYAGVRVYVGWVCVNTVYAGVVYSVYGWVYVYSFSVYGLSRAIHARECLD